MLRVVLWTVTLLRICLIPVFLFLGMRAQAIASYFKRKGIKIPIFYQGFGEDVLWVKTDDNVDESRNRRALYLLGNQRPPISDMIPRSEWKRLQ